MSDAHTTVSTMYERIQAGDIPGALEQMHPDIELHEADSIPFYGGVHNGRDAFERDVIAPMFGNYDIEIHEATVRDAGDVQVAFLDLTFTSKETGASVRMPILEASTVEDGLVRRMDIYYKDSAAMAEAFPEGLSQEAHP